jgi:hypothetical protein
MLITTWMTFFSMALERGFQEWVVQIDLYNIYSDVNKTGENIHLRPEVYHNLKLTPAFIFPVANIQIIANLAVFISLTYYTKVK